MKKMLLFRGGGVVLDFFTTIFERSFRELGVETVTVDTEKEPSDELKRGLSEGAFSAGFCCNFLGLNYSLDEKGDSIWDRFSLPVYHLILDHPFHFDAKWETVPERMTLLVIDCRHIDFLKRFYSTTKDVVFFPHGGLEAPIPHPDLKDRPISVLYAGNLSRIEAQGLIPDLSSVDRYDALKACRSILSALTEEPEYTTEETIERYFNEISIGFSDEELKKEIVRLRFLESFAVSYFREQAILRFLESGIDVTVYGRGWEETEYALHPNLTLGGVIPPAEVLYEMNRAKVVFSTETWFKAGAHERVFNGQLARSLVVTDDSAYLSERFPENRELLRYSLKETAELPDKVLALLLDEKKAREMADRGFAYASSHDTWTQRFRNTLPDIFANINA